MALHVGRFNKHLISHPLLDHFASLGERGLPAALSRLPLPVVLPPAPAAAAEEHDREDDAGRVDEKGGEAPGQPQVAVDQLDPLRVFPEGGQPDCHTQLAHAVGGGGNHDFVQDASGGPEGKNNGLCYSKPQKYLCSHQKAEL